MGLEDRGIGVSGEITAKDIDGRSSISKETDDSDVQYKSLTIPELSSGVRLALMEGKSGEVWGQLLDELLYYYVRKYPKWMNCSEDYQIVGKMLYKTYPSIGRFGNHPWVS